MFTLSARADITGTSTQSEIEVAPALIVRRFGPPAPSDEYKISGQYVFVDEQGEPFVVHDWKATSVWHPSLPSPEEFWAGEEPEEFSVASRDVDTTPFEQWFFEQLGLDGFLRSPRRNGASH